MGGLRTASVKMQCVYFYTSSEQIARVASCIEPYFSLQIHANPSWLTVYHEVVYYFVLFTDIENAP